MHEEQKAAKSKLDEEQIGGETRQSMEQVNRSFDSKGHFLI